MGKGKKLKVKEDTKYLFHNFAQGHLCSDFQPQQPHFKMGSTTFDLPDLTMKLKGGKEVRFLRFLRRQWAPALERILKLCLHAAFFPALSYQSRPKRGRLFQRQLSFKKRIVTDGSKGK